MSFPQTNPALMRALADRGYEEPTSVQAAVLESTVAERDLLVSAQTGSGKTVAYGLALASTLLGGKERFGPAEDPLALIIAPTRELALQVHQELGWLYGQTGARIVSCVGGMDPRREQRALVDGAQIVVGTPGRLRDHLERGNLDTSKLRAVVLDEADEMLDLGFREDLQFILDAAPAERRTLLFSATIAREIASLARQYQKDAARIDTLVRNEPHGDIEYRALRIAPNEVEHAVVNTLRFYDVRASLVFCATREGVKRLNASLLERGFATVALSGELGQQERSQALQSLREGRARVCVATDVAARGLDLPDLGLVIHADLPNGREVLLHRSGRTGRAGRKGISVVLVPHTVRRKAERLLGAAGVDVTWAGPPKADEIRLRDQQRMLEDPILTEASPEEDRDFARSLLKNRTPEQIASALVRLYRSRLPEPEDFFEQLVPETRMRRAEDDRGAKGDGGFAWFRIAIGHDKNADPKWLLPLICRRGHVTKREIGAIRISERETRFEVAAEAAEKFAAALRQSEDDAVRIEPIDPDAAMPARGEGRPGRKPGGRPPFKGGPKGKGDRPFRSREGGGERTGERPPRAHRADAPRSDEARAAPERPAGGERPAGKPRGKEGFGPKEGFGSKEGFGPKRGGGFKGGPRSRSSEGYKGGDGFKGGYKGKRPGGGKPKRPEPQG